VNQDMAIKKKRVSQKVEAAAKKVSLKGHKLVIVESPTKAKTIRRFLPNNFVVESCMGHVRDLPQSAKDIPEKYKKFEWANLGVNVENKFAPIYCIPKDKTKVVKSLSEKLASADEVYLATDEDREGESISWHLVEVLKPKVPVKRMVFNEITKEAILRAMQETRDIDTNLVRAQEARRILDRLVGYTISPLLWKKIAYGLSAGRVQSVAVRLIAEKEMERLRFKKASYKGVSALLEKAKIGFEARLLQWKNARIATGKDFDDLTGELKGWKDLLLLDENTAADVLKEGKRNSFLVSEVEEKPVSRRPAPPFITSTLQQEANRKLGWSSRETMQVAQKLYEQGFITYMRTDSTFLSEEAIKAARNCISEKYGKEYLPETLRNYAAKKVKGAQEAHEAIRPAGQVFQDPEQTGLIGNQAKLYELIWKRTVACQMTDARQKQVSVKIASGPAIYSASGMTIEFPGFLRAYVEGSDDPEAELQEREVRLPKLLTGDKVDCKELAVTDHETKPPARYTEASLVQKMEKEGIGRPSTYASIIGTIIDRGYARKGGNALVPTFTALIVARLLQSHLPQFVDLGFTSEMEKKLDDIAEGDLDFEDYLEKIYFGKAGLKTQVKAQEKSIDPDTARSLIIPSLKGFVFKVGKYGAYVCTEREEGEICASIPEAEAPADMTPEAAEKLIDQKINGADAIGLDPKTSLPVYVLTGRYGPYVQLGDSAGDKAKPKRVSVPPQIPLEKIDLQAALDLLSLPKLLGTQQETGKEIKVGLGRFGPFVVCDGDYRSVPKGENLFTLTLERAKELLSQPKKGRGRAAPLRELGQHPETQVAVQIMNGPYGPYVKSGKTNVSLPEGQEVEKVTLAQAIELLATKAKMGKRKRAS
jgi:DNA topoisomerase-1